MEDDIEQHRKDIEELIAHHQAEESARIELLEESVKWYEKELVKVGNVSLNPFSWKKRKK